MSEQDLMQRVLSFRVDSGTPGLTFVQRLARENGWSLPYAERVYAEYLRFVYLCRVSDTMLTPSGDVDQAWHLHLTYSQSYWERLCGEVLGQPLHHGPTRGGAQEERRYRDAYETTITRYEQTFGENAPLDIWPGAAERFSPAQAYRRTNTANNVVLSKRVLVRIAAGFVLFVAAYTVFVGPGLLSGLLGTVLVLLALPALFLLILSLAARSRRWGRGGGGGFDGCGSDGCGGGGCGGGD